jgi:hypothetical protein
MKDAVLKVVTTKLAKQVSGYALIMFDMQFSSRMFGLAAKQATRTAAQISNERPSVESRFQPLLQMDPILRAGATIATIDLDYRNDSEAIKSGLFEAGVVTYGRCFNSGIRTRLSASIFKGELSGAKRLHDALIAVRNKHIAHSELKMERSIMGCQLVDDQNYGRRPNLIMTTLAIRRHFPTDDRLTELESHCNAIVAHVIEPKLIESARGLREQLLEMPAEQIARFKDFDAEVPTIDELV